MIKAKDKKKETLAYRARAKAVDEMMKSSAGSSAALETAAPAPRGRARAMPAPEMAPTPGMAPPGMKKGGKVDFSKIVRNTKTGQLSEKPGMKKGGKVPPKKPGLMIMIAVGKKKGK
jgi:hypothetical protein